ncbi:hypothetical protein FACS1894163_00070 [Spirochaetia bacterium]|nr:hypothetical protein FACS1894163_00070 [Spirochaetia bacterium]
MNNATIQIRTDANVKEKADSILSSLGITLSDGMNIFLRQVIMNNGLPFDVRLTGQTQIKNINPTQKLSAEKEKLLALVESSCGAFKDCSFSTERYFAQKKRDKELER